jgi:hypothetical protein
MQNISRTWRSRNVLESVALDAVVAARDYESSGELRQLATRVLVMPSY